MIFLHFLLYTGINPYFYYYLNNANQSHFVFFTPPRCYNSRIWTGCWFFIFFEIFSVVLLLISRSSLYARTLVIWYNFKQNVYKTLGWRLEMPEYRWSRFVMCFYNKKAQYDRKYKSNFNYYFLRECVGQQNTFLRIISSAWSTKQGWL